MPQIDAQMLSVGGDFTINGGGTPGTVFCPQLLPGDAVESLTLFGEAGFGTGTAKAAGDLHIEVYVTQQRATTLAEARAGRVVIPSTRVAGHMVAVSDGAGGSLFVGRFFPGTRVPVFFTADQRFRWLSFVITTADTDNFGGSVFFQVFRPVSAPSD